MKLTKKLISTISVFAMLISMFSSLTASAEETEIIKLVKLEKSTATEIYVDAVTTIDAAVVSLTFQMDFSKVPGVVDVVATKNTDVLTGLGGAGKYTSGKVMVNDTNTSGSMVSDGSVIASYVITLSAPLAANADISASNVIMQIDSDGDMKADIKYNLKGTNGFLLAKTPALTLAPAATKAATISTPVAGNNMYEMKTALTKIAFKSVENPVVRLYKDGEESENSKKGYALPSNVKGGAAEIIGIIRYAADVTGEFVLKVFDGETEIDKATYVAE